MQSTKTVQEVYEEQAQWFNQHQPVNKGIIMGNYEFTVDDLLSMQVPKEHFLVPISEDPNRKAYGLMPHAFNQFMQRIGYPETLYNKMPAKLSYDIINRLIQYYNKNDNMMLRIQDGSKIRAVVTDKFSPVDDLELLQMTMPFIEGGTVRWEYDNEMTFHLSVTFPNQVVEIKKGDIAETGIHIRNSEVGLGSVTIAGYVWRYVCGNGMIGHSGDDNFFKYKHVGDGDRIRESIREALDSVKMANSGIKDKFLKALETSINQPLDWFREFAKRHGYTKGQAEGMTNELVSSKEDLGNLFGMSQAIAFIANSKEGEAAYDLQKLGMKALESGLK